MDDLPIESWWFIDDLPIENGPVEIVDLPIRNGDFP